MKELLKLREEFEVVGDVRGKGLMLGLELVKSKVGHIRAAAGCIHQTWKLPNGSKLPNRLFVSSQNLETVSLKHSGTTYCPSNMGALPTSCMCLLLGPRPGLY